MFEVFVEGGARTSPQGSNLEVQYEMVKIKCKSDSICSVMLKETVFGV